MSVTTRGDHKHMEDKSAIGNLPEEGCVDYLVVLIALGLSSADRSTLMLPSCGRGPEGCHSPPEPISNYSRVT